MSKTGLIFYASGLQHCAGTNLGLLLLLQDATGKLGGSLVLSTSSTGSSSVSSGQLVDRLTIDSNGLATFTGSVALPAASSSLTVAGNTNLSTVSVTGNSVIGISSTQSLTINAATTFSAAITANAPLTVATDSNFSALGSTVLGNSSSNALAVYASTTFAAPVIATAPVTVTSGNAFSALGNVLIGSTNANSLLVNANATFNGAATFSQSVQLFSNSSTASSGAVLGFQRTIVAAAISTGFTLGGVLFSGYDGSVQGPIAQIRSVFTVSAMRQ